MLRARDGGISVLETRLPVVLKASGSSLVVASSTAYLLVHAFGVESIPLYYLALHLLFVAPFFAALLYGGHWLERSDLPAGRRPRIGLWFFGGLVGFLLLNVLMIIPWSSGSLWGDFSWGVFAASAGGAAGLVIGVFEARMVERELAVERSRIRREEAERRSERFEDFARIVSHDLRNPLNVATGNVEFVREENRNTQLDAAADALDRMEEIIEETLTLARSGQVIGETEPVALFEVVESCWGSVATDGAELRIEGSTTISADPDRLRHLFENLLRNSVEHGSTSSRTQSGDSVEHGSAGSRPEADDSVGHAGDDVTIRVGPLEGGFYVEDDGPGIADDEREEVFEAGYSTRRDGTGFGLAIVRQVADAHGWTVDVHDADDGGARFEFGGVETVDAERGLLA